MNLTLNQQKTLVRLTCGALFLLIALPLFIGPAEFIGDDLYLCSDNPFVVKPGLASLKAIWTTPTKLEYFPLTITSYLLEYSLWGDAVRLFRLTNILIYFAIGLAAHMLFREWMRALEGGEEVPFMTFLPVLLLVMLHPINVESVALVAHRKELLCVLFGLLSVRWYLASCRAGRLPLASLALLALAQLSKGTAVVLPVIFLILELFVLTRACPFARRAVRVAASWTVAGTLFIIQFRVAAGTGVVAKSPDISAFDHVLGVVRAFSSLITSLVWPLDLSYDRNVPWPSGSLQVMELFMPMVLIAGLAALALTKRRNLCVMFLVCLIPLAPYLNIVPLRHNMEGQMVIYDHYLLFSTILLALPLGYIAGNLEISFKGMSVRSMAPAAVCLVLLITFSFLDHRLFGAWLNPETLYKHTILATPEMPQSYFFLGERYVRQGRYAEAIAVLERGLKATKWDDTFGDALQSLGDAYAFSGGYQHAELYYRKHLALAPHDATSHQHLTNTLIMQGKYADAREQLAAWADLRPADEAIRRNLNSIVERMERGGR